MMATHPNSKTIANKSNGSQFPASTFPETFKDFFSMINEDEDQVELVSNLLEDKVRLKIINHLDGIYCNCFYDNIKLFLSSYSFFGAAIAILFYF